MKTINDLQDSKYILIHSGTGDDIELNSEFNTDYDGFFISVKNGDYDEVWGFYGCVPLLSTQVYKIK